MTPDDLQQALPLFDEFVQRFAPRLDRDAQVQPAQAYLRGLLLDNDDNKTAEAIALKVYQDPSRVRPLQLFLADSPWTDQPVRVELTDWVNADLGHDDGVLVIDEGSFPKAGTKSVGVARQYCGELGKKANCQVAVYCAYASAHGHTLLDTRLYLPEHWAADTDRRRAAGVPDDVVFRTKPELGVELVLHLAPRLRHAWVTFDEGYGKDPGFLAALEEVGERYIGEVPKNVRVWLQRPAVESPGPSRHGRARGKARVKRGEPAPQTVEEVAASWPASAWKRLTFRDGTKGPQVAEFARARVVAERDDLPGPDLWLVVERSLEQKPVLKYYLSWSEPSCPLLAQVRAGHTRWPVEECFLRGKGEVGLGEYEVQGWRGWHHHQTLVLLALWFLLLQQKRLAKKKWGPGDDAA
jgi:SRSO17 transposase